MVLEFSNVVSDTYSLKIRYNDGYAKSNSHQKSITVNVKASSLTIPAANKVHGYAGGKLIINGFGFDSTNKLNNVVRICNYDCDIQTATNTQIECLTQGIINPDINT